MSLKSRSYLKATMTFRTSISTLAYHVQFQADLDNLAKWCDE